MEHIFKEYALCTSDSLIRSVMLRETSAYYISKDGKRYKKQDFKDGAIAFNKIGDRYHTSTYYIHPVDCPTVEKYINRAFQRRKMHEVKDHLAKLSRSISTYDQAVDIAKKLGLENVLS